ncbi:MAG: ABC transporter ATP-binding protein [Ruminiclostridium sp.]|nr:ABC transporter ATP-binding protein [Ruminiclostridium sp.]
MDILLKAEHISREFDVGNGNIVRALTDVSLDVNEGELVCLRGRSGSGKTTLINILGALDRQSGGNVTFCGRDIGALSDGERDKLRRKELGFVFQSVALISTMTALENVELSLRLAGHPISGRIKRAKECLTRVGLGKRMDHRPGELSGGEQQRVAIARAVAAKPKLIFADEPTAALDSNTGTAVLALFRELVRDDGITVVMTTHDEAMMQLADIVYELSDGKIVNVIRNDIPL